MSNDIKINELKNEIPENIVSIIGNLNTMIEAEKSIKKEGSVLSYLKFGFAFNGFLDNLSKTSNNINKLFETAAKKNFIPEVTTLSDVI